MIVPGVVACDKTIDRLIKRVACRIFSEGNLGGSDSCFDVTIPATKKSLPEYFKLQSFSDREDYHARLNVYVNAGAVHVDWDRGAGEFGQLERVTMVNPSSLLSVIDIELPWLVAERSIHALRSSTTMALPILDEIIEAWSKGKSPGGIPADRAEQFIDSIKIIEAASGLESEKKDTLLRRLSVQLFGDSKRIERLAKPLIYLLKDQYSVDEENVFSYLGLVKHPQPMLLSGTSSYQIEIEGGEELPMVRPYIGIRPDMIKSLRWIGRKQPIHMMTVENLASFNEAAQATNNPEHLLLVYVAGNPTPSFIQAYQRLLRSIQPAKLSHWGDIDVGGFRIAARLADSASSAGFKLSLWNMLSPKKPLGFVGAAPKDKVAQALQICQSYGWEKEYACLERHSNFQEQEFIQWCPTLLNEV